MIDKNKYIRILIAGFIFSCFGVMFLPFFTPILMAALFAFALDPLVSRYGRKRSTRRVPILLILLSIFMLILVPITIVGYRLTSTATNLAASGLNNTEIYKSLESFVLTTSEKVNNLLAEMHINPISMPDQSEFIGKVGAWFVAFMAAMAGRAPELVLTLFIFSASLYFFLAESKKIRRAITGFQVVSDPELDQIIHLVQRSSYITLVATALIGSVQASIVAFGGMIFGYSEFMLLFVITFCTSLIPVVGASPIAILLALFSLVQGDIKGVIGMAVVAVIAGSVDNIIKPWVVSSSGDEELNPVIALIAIIGAVMVYGLPGLLLGPILTQLAFKIVPILFGKPSAEAVVAKDQSP